MGVDDPADLEEDLTVDFSSLLSTGLAIVSIATLAGLGALRGVVTNLREQLKDARDETKALKEGRAEDRAKIAELEAGLTVMARTVTGEAHWVALGHQLEDHHTAALTHWARDEQILGEIRDHLRERP